MCISVCLNTEDCASECCCLVTPPGVQATVLMGTYSINWKRSALRMALDQIHVSFKTRLNPKIKAKRK